MKFCEIPFCENPATKGSVRVSVNKPHDERRRLCAACREAYYWGVQHGRHHEASRLGTQPGQDDSQIKPVSAGKKRIVA